MEVGQLWVKLGLDKSNFDKGINETKNQSGGFSGFLKNAFAFTVGQGMFDLLKTGLKSAWDMSLGFNSGMEQSSAAFTTLLGDAGKAKTILADLSKFAANTPFEMADLNKASQVLLGFGIDAQKVMPDLKMLGDVSMGNKDKFQGLALVFAQVQSAGKMTGQDLMQLINNGFNPLQVMSKQTGLSMAELKEKMEKGAISADMVTSAFQSATSEGGLFYGAMDKQSKTFEGQMSTLKDTIAQIFGGLFKNAFENLSTNLLPRVTNGLSRFQEVMKLGGNAGVALRETIKTIFGPDISATILSVTDKLWGLGQTLVGVISGDTEAVWTGLGEWMGIPLGAADLLTNALMGIRETISGAFSWITDNGEIVKTLLFGIASAFTAYKVAVLATTIAQEANNAVSAIMAIVKGREAIQTLLAAEATGSNTIAQWLLNAAQLASPTTWIILAIIALVGALVYLWNTNEGFRNALIGAWNSIKETALAVFNGIANFLTWLWNAITTAAMTAWNFIATTVSGIINGFVSTITGIFNGFMNFIQPYLTLLQTFWTNVWEMIKTIVLGIVLIFIDLLTGNFTKLKEDAANILNKLKDSMANIWNAIVNFAFTAWNGLKNTVISLVGNIKDGAINIWNNLLSWFSNLPGRLYTYGVNMFTSLKNGAVSILNGLGSTISSLMDSAMSYIKNMPGAALQWGRDIIQGIVNGIKSAASAVGDAVNGVAQDIRAFLHFTVPDKGPLADFDTYMPDMIDLMATGITDNKPKLLDKVKDMAAGMSIGVKGSMVGINSIAKGVVSTSAGGYGTANIIVELDGKVLARILGQKLVDLIRIKTGVRL